MRRLIWSDNAGDDVLAIGAFYDLIDLALSDKVLDRIAKAPGILLSHPYAGPAREERNLRKWPVADTPFLILYRAFEDRIEIARVHDGRQDWRR